MTITLNTDIDRLKAAFSLLESKGITAKTNFWCCGGCATAALDQDKDVQGFAYWHEQDDERAFGRGTEEYDCGTCVGSGTQTCDACHGEGVDEEGDECITCGGTREVPCDACDGQSTYEEDSGERLHDDLHDDLYIGYGHRDESKSLNVGIEVVKALVEQGFEVEWDGDTSRRILVKKDS